MRFMLISKIIFIPLLFLLVTLNARAYNIQIKFQGLPNVSVMLAEYVGDSYFFIDTTKTDVQGNGIFLGKKELNPGIYYLVLPNSSSLEILLNEQQDLVIETNVQHPFENLNVYGSEESAAYVQYQKFTASQFKEMQRLTYELKSNKEDLNLVYRKMKELANVEKNLENRKAEIIQKHPDWQLSEYLRLTLDNLEGTEIQSMDMKSMVRQYFKHYGLQSRAVLRTPYFKDGVFYYLKKYVDNDPEKTKRCTEALLAVPMHSTVKTTYMNLIHKYFSQQVLNVSVEKCLVAMAHAISDTGLNDLDFFPSPLLKKQTTFAGNNLPDNLLQLLSENKSFMLAVWDPSCNKCTSDKKHLHQVKQPVYVLVLGNSKGLSGNPANLNFIDFNKVQQTEIFQDFPIEQTPVYFQVDSTGKILQKTYEVKDLM